MFAIDAEQHIHVFSEGGTIKPESGWSVIGMVSSKTQTAGSSPLDGAKPALS
jgi:hypothetical protein